MFRWTGGYAASPTTLRSLELTAELILIALSQFVWILAIFTWQTCRVMNYNLRHRLDS